MHYPGHAGISNVLNIIKSRSSKPLLFFTIETLELGNRMHRTSGLLQCEMMKQMRYNEIYIYIERESYIEKSPVFFINSRSYFLVTD